MTGDSGQVPAAPRPPGQDPGSPRGSAASQIRSNPVPVSATTGLLTEGPRWHAERGELLWVDILGHSLHRGRPGPDGALESVETITVDRPVGAVAPATGGGYVLAAATGFLYVDDAGRPESWHRQKRRTDVRMNDGACDPQGRFWGGPRVSALARRLDAGTAAPPLSALMCPRERLQRIGRDSLIRPGLGKASTAMLNDVGQRPTKRNAPPRATGKEHR